MDVKNTHSVTKTEISVFGRQALDAERRRSPSLADGMVSMITKQKRFLPTNEMNVHQENVFCDVGRYVTMNPAT